jgi:hypothetical protein
MSEHDRLTHIELKVALGASKHDRLSSKIIWTVVIFSAAVSKTIISSFFEPACSSRTVDTAPGPNDPPSKCQTQAKKKYIRGAFILRHLSGHRVPDVLITWNQPHRRSDRDTVKDLQPLLVLESGCGSGEPRDIIFQRLTDSIVIDSQSKTVIGPVVREAIGKQRYARITRDRVGFLWGISDAAEQTNSSERLAAPEFLSDRQLMAKPELKESSTEPRQPGELPTATTAQMVTSNRSSASSSSWPGPRIGPASCRSCMKRL